MYEDIEQKTQQLIDIIVNHIIVLEPLRCAEELFYKHDDPAKGVCIKDET